MGGGLEAELPPRAAEDAAAASTESSGPLTTIDDEEKARDIANNDLRGPKKQTYSGLVLLWLSFQATGIIYGDIGTSPLYVFSSTFSAQPSWADLVGALSIIIWSLTLIVTVKYCFIVLAADDDGQGGTFALYSLLARYTNITRRGPRDPSSSSSAAGAAAGAAALKRHDTNDLKLGGRSLRGFLERSPASQLALQFVGVLGVSMVMADGVLTPAQSVLGAIQGLRVVRPDLGAPAIVGVSCAILVALFLVQPLGTAGIGTAFAPVVAVWLLFNLAAGAYNLAAHDWTVLGAFGPHHAFLYLARNGADGWRSLGGLLLAFTGVEALFADLGAFSKRAVQISWLALAYPCLLLAYAGQAAAISADATQTAFQNPFFATLPPGSFYLGMVIAVLAAVVASQAMITSTFQLLTQIMRLSYFPHIKVVHTSRRFHDQVYMPMANWLLMIGTIIITAVYNNTTSLGNAYGVCVITVTFITTCMVAIVAILVWRLPAYVVLPVWLVFAALDGAFLSSVFGKVPDGAWFTLLLAFILASIFTLWRFGKETQWAAEAKDPLSPQSLLDLDVGPGHHHHHQQAALKPAYGGIPLSTTPGLGVFFDKTGDPSSLPTCFAEFVKKFATRPAVVIFFHMRPLPRPWVAPEERYVVTRMAGLAGCYSIALRHGYTDHALHPDVARDLVGQVELAVSRGPATAASDAELRVLRAAAGTQVVYVLGKEVIKIRPPRSKASIGGFLRYALLWVFLWIRENSRTKLADLDIDANKLIEVGFVKEI